MHRMILVARRRRRRMADLLTIVVRCTMDLLFSGTKTSLTDI